MKYLLGVTLALMIATPLYVYTQGQAPAAAGAAAETAGPLSKVVFIDHDAVAQAFAKGGRMVTASDVRVSANRRDKPGQVEVHDKEMDVMYIMEGSGTIVTGGTMVGGKNSSPGQWLGTEITGGTTQKIVKGDVIAIPAGVPHWFKEVQTTLVYYNIKVFKP